MKKNEDPMTDPAFIADALRTLAAAALAFTILVVLPSELIKKWRKERNIAGIATSGREYAR